MNCDSSDAVLRGSLYTYITIIYIRVIGLVLTVAVIYN